MSAGHVDVESSLATRQVEPQVESESVTGRSPKRRRSSAVHVHIGATGSWSAKEDAILRFAVDACGDEDWELIASHLASRDAEQCLRRWQHISAKSV